MDIDASAPSAPLPCPNCGASLPEQAAQGLTDFVPGDGDFSRALPLRPPTEGAAGSGHRVLPLGPEELAAHFPLPYHPSLRPRLQLLRGRYALNPPGFQLLHKAHSQPLIHRQLPLSGFTGGSRLQCVRISHACQPVSSYASSPSVEMPDFEVILSLRHLSRQQNPQMPKPDSRPECAGFS